MMPEQAPGFRGTDGAGVPIQQLLAQGLFHQLDLPGDGRGRQAFAACDLGETAVVQHRHEQAQRLETQLIEALHEPSVLCDLRKGVVCMLPFIAQMGQRIMRVIV